MRRGQSLLLIIIKNLGVTLELVQILAAKNKGIYYQYRRAGQAQLVIFGFFFAF